MTDRAATPEARASAGTGEPAPGDGPDASPSEGVAPPAEGEGLAAMSADIAATFAQWRRVASRNDAAAVQTVLSDAAHCATLARVFAGSKYLTDIAMTHADVAIQALKDGPTAILADAARDLSAFDRGAGGPDELHAAVKPVKERCDLAIALAEISGRWTNGVASAARADFAERVVETALQWLLRGAFRRGAASSEEGEGGAVKGIFALAGEAFASEEISVFGPLSVIVLFDKARIATSNPAMLETTLHRLGVELRRAIEGPPGGRALYRPQMPDVTGTAARPMAVSVASVEQSLAQPKAEPRRAWFQTARVIAGDRVLGGEFLEAIAAEHWEGKADAASIRAAIAPPAEEGADATPALDAIAQICRLTLGRGRPAFRTASARRVFETAGEVGALPCPVAEQLSVAADFARDAANRLQLASGAPSRAPKSEAEMRATAQLMGFFSADAFETARAGFAALARDALARVLDEGDENLERLGAALANRNVDAEKLEDLGFNDGRAVSGLINRWLAANGGAEDARLSALAPGFLTYMAETQNPEEAAALFDRFVHGFDESVDVFGVFRKHEAVMARVADLFGCFGRHAGAAIDGAAAREALEPPEDAAPASAEEWMSRHAPPWRGAKDAPDADSVARWLETNRARLAIAAASQGADYAMIANAAACIVEEAIAGFAGAALRNAPKAEREAAENLVVMIAGHAAAGRALWGEPLPICFVCANGQGDAASAHARRLADLIETPGSEYRGLPVDLRARPGGAGGPLAATHEEFRTHHDSQAAALEQVKLAGYRIVAGPEKARKAVEKIISGMATGVRRADYLMRDVDRGRVQRLRRDGARSIWDVARIEGGLEDVDLLIGVLKKKYAATQPYVLGESTQETLDALVRSGALTRAFADELAGARALWRRLLTIEDLAGWSGFDARPPAPRLARLVAQAAGVSRFEDVEPLIRGHADRINVLYNHLMLGREKPFAAAAGARMVH